MCRFAILARGGCGVDVDGEAVGDGVVQPLVAYGKGRVRGQLEREEARVRDGVRASSGRGVWRVCSVKRVSPHSAGVAGSRVRPHTKRRKRARFSGENLRSACQR